MRSMTLVLVLGIEIGIGVAAGRARGDAVHNSAHLNTSYLNGKYLNGKYLNGKYLNTALINGGIVNGDAVQGVSRSGTPVADVHLRNSELVGFTDTYDPTYHVWYPELRDGDWFVGAVVQATFIGEDDSLDVGTLRIDSFERAPQPDDDVTVYTISALVATSLQEQPQWVPICGRDVQGAPIKVIPLQGTWSYRSGNYWGGAKLSDSADAVTFACLDGALGKCAAASYPNTIGYKPWRSSWMWLCDDDGGCSWTYRDWQDLHQTCTRMVRADYCGDGTTHTVTGMDIDIYDTIGFKIPDYSVPRRFEAMWRPDGTSWLSCYRVGPLAGGECPVYTDPYAYGVLDSHVVMHACPMSEDPPVSDGDLIGDRVLSLDPTPAEIGPPRSM
jgi:ADYC domain